LGSDSGLWHGGIMVESFFFQKKELGTEGEE
jgi:hypothetical protein